MRCIRDPRDLIISGYFYHKRAGEEWCNYINPCNEDWEIVNGNVPTGIPQDKSYTEYLNLVSMEEGFAAEMEFRKLHFESMMLWPDNDERIKLFKYEDIIGKEIKTIREIMKFYDMPALPSFAGSFYAARYSAALNMGRIQHIRDASNQQWRKYFTPALQKIFISKYKELLIKYDYPLI